jgi:hypothetical protein
MAANNFILIDIVFIYKSQKYEQFIPIMKKQTKNYKNL